MPSGFSEVFFPLIHMGAYKVIFGRQSFNCGRRLYCLCGIHIYRHTQFLTHQQTTCYTQTPTHPPTHTNSPTTYRRTRLTSAVPPSCPGEGEACPMQEAQGPGWGQAKAVRGRDSRTSGRLAASGVRSGGALLLLQHDVINCSVLRLLKASCDSKFRRWVFYVYIRGCRLDRPILYFLTFSPFSHC